jgi:hypothetical protein
VKPSRSSLASPGRSSPPTFDKRSVLFEQRSANTRTAPTRRASPRPQNPSESRIGVRSERSDCVRNRWPGRRSRPLVAGLLTRRGSILRIPPLGVIYRQQGPPCALACDSVRSSPGGGYGMGWVWPGYGVAIGRPYLGEKGPVGSHPGQEPRTQVLQAFPSVFRGKMAP